MQTNNFVLYKHTSPTGKVYIGITCQNPTARWRGGLGYRHNGHFFNAIMRYGWENFKHEILYEGMTRAEACQKEKELIAEYRSTDERYGYNLTIGGDGCPGAVKTEEFRQGQSEKTRLLWCDPEYREHMVEVHKGKKQSQETIDKRRNSYLIGHPVSEKTKQKARERATGNKFRARAVLCVEKNMEFDTIKEAADWAGITPPTINRHLHGKKKSAGGYHWRYVKED